MVVFLLAGCSFGGDGKKEDLKLDITVTLEEGGEGKVQDVVLVVGGKAVTVDEQGNATATVAKGDVEIKATLTGYQSYQEKINVTKDSEHTIQLKVAVAEKALVDAVVKAASDNKVEDFLKALNALQEAGLVTGVVKEHAPLYLEQARDFGSPLKPLTLDEKAAFMRNAAEVQMNVIDPVNAWVSEHIAAIKNAGSKETMIEALEDFAGDSGLLNPVQVGGETVQLHADFIQKYPSNTVADLQAIILGVDAQLAVDELFEKDETGKYKVDPTTKKYVVAEIEQDALSEAVTKVGKVTISELKAELNSLIELVKAELSAREEAEFVETINDGDADELAMLLVNDLKVSEFVVLLTPQRDEVASRLVDARGVTGYKPYESTAAFVVAVKAEVDKYLGLIAAVNNAKTNVEMADALAAIDSTFAEKNWNEQLSTAERMLELKEDEDWTPWKTIAKILAALNNLEVVEGE
jgi:hypothetical protein